MVKRLIIYVVLFLFIGLAGIYATTPLWLPGLFAKQLPQGWRLESIDTGYPGLSGISISTLALNGEFQTAKLKVKAENIRFNYEDLRTSAGAVLVDIYLLASETTTDDSSTWDEFSLPDARLSGRLPHVTINELSLNIHDNSEATSGNSDHSRPQILILDDFDLTPHSDNSFHISSRARLDQLDEVSGHIEIDTRPGLLNADIKLAAGPDMSPWLTLVAEQADLPGGPSTSLQWMFDASLAKREWLDSFLLVSSRGAFTHVDGKVLVNADFSGRDLQTIKHYSMSTSDLRLESDLGVLKLKTELLADREDEKIVVTLASPTEINYLDSTGTIDDLLLRIAPFFKRGPQATTSVFARFDSDSRFEISPGDQLKIEFDGAIRLDLESPGEVIHFDSANLNAKIADFPKLESLKTDGLISVEWQQLQPFTYIGEGIEMSADTLSATTTINSNNHALTSSGQATIHGGHYSKPEGSAERIDMRWQDFDLLNRAGNFSTQTHGLVALIDAETWSDFDFDINGRLHEGNSVTGSGALQIVNGPSIPLDFTGNLDVGKWDVSIQPMTVALSRLRRLLTVAHIELPDSVKLTDGYLDMQGTVHIEDEMSANMLVQGRELGAKMLKNGASNGSLRLNANFDQTLSAIGQASIETITLAGGISLRDVKADIDIANNETIALKNLTAELFDGKLDLEFVRFTNDRIEDSTAKLSQANLARLLEFADLDGLTGTGSLDIILPVSFDDIGINVRNGTFNSTTPGRLAYLKAGVVNSNIGLKALENFQYKDLSGTIEYHSDGSYRIGVHLEGKNPDLYGGHPVVFNLNINGSLPALFEVLFITGDFEEAILKEIRKK